ncbi:hypothetical protein DEU56DRAFT_971851 [Suillus clintonianus]|uniref:uncharacterized protein n=1 Tax=Suillus clintonianus TaxID=1904413 RepID=UPI001B869140|nr:uncharacterized protein DEU56DRAFT_971851 [Suillus clintonianus]KAG2143682.1 hypothetical protein DEU56DRAFT_971851 [Suillus clintonianus]
MGQERVETACSVIGGRSIIDRADLTVSTLSNIISSSVLTLFACIYSAVHPNIPSPKDSPFCILRRRLGIMMAALIAPELVVVWAMRQWISAHYAWTQTHSFFVLMGGFMLYVDGEPYHTLQPDDRICDKSKGNVISKGLIILQVAWFILQLMSRAIYHLETTQLETGTLAFAVLNFLTYALWWVQCPFPVYWKSTELKPEDHVRIRFAHRPNNEDAVIFAMTLGPFRQLMGFSDRTRKLRVPTFDGSLELDSNGWDKWILVFAGILMATIFGGIHCTAWFFAFPTNHEQVLWRISAVAITCTPCLEILSYFAVTDLASLMRIYFPVTDRITLARFILGIIGIDDIMSLVAMCIFGLFYIVSRGMLLVLMFTTLRHLPLDAYTTVSWISFVPHL